ncbi:MAG: outer membrane protein [Pseudomonadales bacterium]
MHQRSFKFFHRSQRLLASACVTAFVFCSFNTQAHENQAYIELGLGASIATGELQHAGPNSNGTPNYDMGNTSVKSFAIGYQMINGLRLELDFRDRELEIASNRTVATRPQSAFNGSTTETFIASGNVDSRTRMLNVAYVGELIKPQWTAYLKLGVGEAKNRTVATVDVEPTFIALGNLNGDFYQRGSEREFAWSAGTGVSMHITERLQVGLDYQYSNLGDATTRAGQFGDNLETDELAVHEVTARLRLHF